jgi:hypothetical protein
MGASAGRRRRDWVLYVLVIAAVFCVSRVLGSSSDSENLGGGRLLRATVATADDTCSPGTYSNTGSSPCTSCAAGTFQPNKGSTGCFTAPPGYYIPSAGATVCCSNPCPKGKFSRGGATTCFSNRPPPVKCAFPMITNSFRGFDNEFEQLLYNASWVRPMNHTAKLVAFPHAGDTGGGLGNFLVFWPSLFYFAAFSDRKIAITDNSVMGELCKSIKCGTQLLSTVIQKAPAYLQHHFPPNKQTWVNSVRYEVRKLRMGAFLSHFSGEAPVLEEVVSVEGFKSTSNWWMKFNNTVACVSKLSGCLYNASATNMLDENAKFIYCSDKFALKKLIVGPLTYTSPIAQALRTNINITKEHAKANVQKSQKKRSKSFLSRLFGWAQEEDVEARTERRLQVTAEEARHARQRKRMRAQRAAIPANATTSVPAHLSSVVGLPSHLSSLFYTQKHNTLKFVDVGVHLRAQFKGFELLQPPAAYSEEVSSFLQSIESKVVFQSLAERIVYLLLGIVPGRESPERFRTYGQEEVAAKEFIASSRQHSLGTNSNMTNSKPRVVFVSADNEEVKIAFVSYLSQYLSRFFPNKTIDDNDATTTLARFQPPRYYVFYKQAGNVSHCKRFEEMGKHAEGDAMSTLAFDWYALSSARRLISYRRPTGMTSTFVQSALLMGHDRIADSKGHGLYVAPDPETPMVKIQWSRFQ